MTLRTLFPYLSLAVILSARVPASSGPESAPPASWLAYVLIGIGGILLGVAMVGVALTLRRPTEVEGPVPPSAASARAPLPPAVAPPPPAPEPMAPPGSFCGTCGAPLPAEATFCPRCGARK